MTEFLLVIVAIQYIVIAYLYAKIITKTSIVYREGPSIGRIPNLTIHDEKALVQNPSAVKGFKAYIMMLIKRVSTENGSVYRSSNGTIIPKTLQEYAEGSGKFALLTEIMEYIKAIELKQNEHPQEEGKEE